MLPQTEFNLALWNLDPSKRFVYEAGMVLQNGINVILNLGLVVGLSTLIARQLVDPDLSREGLIGAVIMPGVIAFSIVGIGVKRNVRIGNSIGQTLRIAIQDGLKLGLLVGFIVIASWHYLGQLAMARAIYGAYGYQAHPAVYCSPIAALYGFVFTVPVALGCALFTAIFKVGPYMMLNWVNKLPD